MKLKDKKEKIAKKIKPDRYAKTENLAGYPKYVKINHYQDKNN